MTFQTLIRRSLRFHWRSHLGVVLGAAIGSAALIGALVVGDSVKGSLRERALQRLGWTTIALQSGDRMITESLVKKLRHWTRSQYSAAWITNRESICSLESLFYANAVISKQDGSARVNRVNLYVGVPPVTHRSVGDVWYNFDTPEPGDEDIQAQEQFIQARKAEAVTNQFHDPLLARYFQTETNDQAGAYLNEALASQLHAKVGDTILLRFQKQTALSADIVVSSHNEPSESIQLRVGAIVRANQTGDFGLQSSQTAPLNVFIGRNTFTNLTGKPFRPNILTAVWAYRDWPAYSRWSIWREIPWLGRALRFYGLRQLHHYSTDDLSRSMAEFSQLADYQSEFRSDLSSQRVELRSERIFLDPPIVRSALAADTNAQPILTYLATLLRAGTNATPYSMVAAAGVPWAPADLHDDQIVISQWLADDLRVKPGENIALSFFLPESGAKLEEATNIFRVHSIVPMEMPWADRSLMPDFPGIEKAESTSEWDAGFPLTYKVRAKDDEYWKQHRGTPKAFITLAAGQTMWGNRFGNLTAIRFPIPTNEVNSTLTYKETLEKKILANLKPEELGLRFEPVREQALKAAEESQDFGGLFLGFSFFVIAAALLLMAMLFQFGLEQRAPEIGTLLALGFTPKQVRKLFLCEGVVLAFIGGGIGAVGGIYYAKAMIHGLITIWRDAVGATALNFHVTMQTLVMGVFASVVVSTITIWLALRKFVKRAPRELLVGEIQSEESKVQSPKSKIIAILALGGALGLVGWTLAKGDTANAGAFFGAGALVLIAGLAFSNARLGRLSGGDSITLASLAVRSCARRRKRSLATMAMLSCGSFLIVSIGVFRLDANRDATQKTSGTGGFALIGETTMPVVQDLNSKSGREFFALDENDLTGVNFVPFRVRAGDEASCLNLNAAQKPKLLGVNPERLEGRFSFVKGEGWQALGGYARESMAEINQPRSHERSHEIPAIGDANSIQWAMKKKVGDTIDYVDERGQPFKVRIVGAVANSILQGQLIIDEAEFVKRFPGESGYRMFLIDAPSNAVSQVSATLSRAMQDVGLELTPAVQRLNQFNAVQNTYLGTFQILGGLGLLLGSVGLGIVVLRNALERRGELAVMMAVGFRKATLQRLLLMENGALLLAGLALGIVAAAVAVLPALLSANGGLPVVSLTITLGAVLMNGVLWTWAATRFAVRGDLLKALRNE